MALIVLHKIQNSSQFIPILGIPHDNDRYSFTSRMWSESGEALRYGRRDPGRIHVLYGLHNHLRF